MGKGGEHGSNFTSMTMASLLGGVISAATAVVILLCCSVGISAGILPQRLELQFTIAACVIGGLIGGCLTCRRWGSRRLLAGLSAGFVFVLVLLTIRLVAYRELELGSGGFGVIAGCLCGGMLSGLLGGSTKKRRKRN